jgi:methionyl-tRNA formyltransferase
LFPGSFTGIAAPDGVLYDGRMSVGGPCKLPNRRRRIPAVSDPSRLSPGPSHRAIFLIGDDMLAAQVLSAWLAAGHQVAEVWCGRMSPSRLTRSRAVLRWFYPDWTVSGLVRRHALKVRRHAKLMDWEEAPRHARDLGADTLIAAMSLDIVPPRLLELFGGRALNFHPALLPYYRGKDPRVGMRLDGTADQFGGVTAHIIRQGIDRGEIVAARPVPFSAHATHVRWVVAEAKAAGELMAGEVLDYLAGRREAAVQSGEGSYRRLQPGEAILTDGHSLADARRLCAILGHGRLAILAARRKDKARHWRVASVARVLGPPQGTPPSIGLRFIDMDLGDCRVRLRRWSELDATRQRLDTIAAIGQLRIGIG